MRTSESLRSVSHTVYSEQGRYFVDPLSVKSKTKADFSNTKFYKELESGLPASTEAQRRTWATTIAERDVDVKNLSRLLTCNEKVATRFLWLLSDVGLADPDRLLKALPFLLEVSDDLNPAYKKAFASLWNIAGVPPENESRAIDLLFQWVLSADTNVTIKTRSIWVLLKLTKKYPELKSELKVCIEDQMDKYSNDFKKRAIRILAELEDRQ